MFAPFPSFTVLGAELLGPRTVGAGVGFMNAVGYGTAALGDVTTFEAFYPRPERELRR